MPSASISLAALALEHSWRLSPLPVLPTRRITFAFCLLSSSPPFASVPYFLSPYSAVGSPFLLL